VTKSKLVTLLTNGLSIFGAVVTLVTAAVTVFLFVITVLTGSSNPYLGILIYMVLPPFLLLGLLLVPLGMWRTWRRLHASQGEALMKWPKADFNDAGTRRVFAVVLAGAFVYVAASAVGSYQAFHYTESVSFCGQLCHQVMEPEFVAYQHSPHARVTCVQCHVGPGADWFVKSKISGAYQVYAVLADKYPRPIETPIKSLRPAQQVCEQCHWPQKFYGAQQKTFNHFSYDRDNTPWTISLLLKTGGGDPRVGEVGGIHWHMNIGSKVEYVARDERRQDIPWVRVTDKDTGAVTVYQDERQPLTPEQLAAEVPRTMDCVDCHNRPSHIFHPPDHSVDVALQTGRIPADLPAVKSIAVEALVQEELPSRDAANGAIATYITEQYRDGRPEVYQRRRAEIDATIKEVQDIYRRNFFPHMKVSWKVYPVNIGHFYAPGCMRCHREDLVAPDGQSVGTDCNACHLIIAQGDQEHAELAASLAGLEFEHPEDIGDEWRDTGCWECHEGVAP
jgi:hypothetical protein